MGTQRSSSPSPERGQSPQFSAHVYCGQTAALIKMPLGTMVGLVSGRIVLHGNPAVPPRKGHRPPIFGPCFLWPNGPPSQLLMGTCRFWHTDGTADVNSHIEFHVNRLRCFEALAAQISTITIGLAGHPYNNV